MLGQLSPALLRWEPNADVKFAPGGEHAAKKARVLQKLEQFVERYFGLGSVFAVHDRAINLCTQPCAVER